MKAHITELEDIMSELTEIQSILEVELSESPQEIIDRGNYCTAQMARTSKLLSDAKMHKDRKLSNHIIAEMKKIAGLPALTSNKFVDALCADENYIVNWAERLNRACTHQIDWCRTLISKAKAEQGRT